MRLSIDTVRECGKVAEAALCYTGDILDPNRDKYDLHYYINMAKELEKAGANIIAIKDMAGLLKPEAAYRLVSSLNPTSTYLSICTPMKAAATLSTPTRVLLMPALIS